MADDTLEKIFQSVKKLTEKSVVIGVPSENSPRVGENGEPVAVTNAELAYIHEYGVPENNLPARPTLVPGVERVVDKITARLTDAASYILDSDFDSKFNANLHAIGVTAVSSIKDYMQSAPYAPLSPRTIAARLRGRPGGSAADIKPLIDTAQLLNSWAYAIRDQND